MNVVNLLPNHPRTPEWYRFETLLPYQVRQLVLIKFEINVRNLSNNSFGRETFQLTGKLLDASVSGINDQVKVIGH